MLSKTGRVQEKYCWAELYNCHCMDKVSLWRIHLITLKDSMIYVRKDIVVGQARAVTSVINTTQRTSGTLCKLCQHKFCLFWARKTHQRGLQKKTTGRMSQVYNCVVKLWFLAKTLRLTHKLGRPTFDMCANFCYSCQKTWATNQLWC